MRKLVLLLSLIVTVCGLSLRASDASGPARLAPDKPRWGDTITLSYDPAAKGAVFLPGDEIYVYWTVATDGSSERGWARMEKKGDIFQSQVPIPKGAGFLWAYFFTMDAWDSHALIRAMVYRKDGVPAQNAWRHQMTSGDESKYQEAFGHERKLYPKNYAVFRDKWWLDEYLKKGQFKEILKKDMETLRRQAKKESPELLYSLNWGYLHLDDEKTAREILRKLVDSYPESHYTAWALHDHDYYAFSKQITGEGPAEVKKLGLELFRKNPGSKDLHDLCEQISWESNAPLELIRAGCEAWMKDEPDNPRPYYALGYALQKKGGDLKEASSLLGKAQNLLLQGRMKFYGDDIGGSLFQLRMPYYFQTSAEIHEKLGDDATALAETKAAQTLGKEVRPELFLLEASIWRHLGNLRNAVEALLEAQRRGAAKAEEELKAIYAQRHETVTGFETWLARAMEKHVASEPGSKKRAPDFDVKTIDGKTLKLPDLKGKVVVLNFWFIGCAPCRVEMPGLNKLTEEFNSGDVIFIGFALDKADDLRKFLEEVPFKYQIVAESSAVASQYGASVFPTHVLINRQGQIEYLLTGGSANRHEELRPLIQGLLK
jgi:peroxiredoxin